MYCPKEDLAFDPERKLADPPVVKAS